MDFTGMLEPDCIIQPGWKAGAYRCRPSIDREGPDVKMTIYTTGQRGDHIYLRLPSNDPNRGALRVYSEFRAVVADPCSSLTAPEKKQPYGLFYHAGNFEGNAGAKRLAAILAAYCADGESQITAVVPITENGATVGVQIVVEAVATAPSLKRSRN